MELPSGKIYLKRTGVVFSVSRNGTVYEGKRGELKIGGVTLQTIERGGNYVSLPAGEFLMTSYSDSSRGQVLGIQPDGKYGHNVPKWRNGEKVGTAGIMIHAADDPGDLLGCLAPGRSFDVASKTLKESAAAMGDIFTYLGGFGENKLIGWIVVE